MITSDSISPVVNRIQSDMGSAASPLPPATSPNLALVTPTPTERLDCLLVNAASWKGPLTPDQYIRREALLADQPLTNNGALSFWILVDKTQQPDSRTILASCEAYAKRAFLAYNGKTEDVVAHSVGSVYCRAEFRGRGYAKRMIAELARMLEQWQREKKSVFSVLYSDIGREFYAAFGWKPCKAAHVSLPPARQTDPAFNMSVTDLTAEDVKTHMCSDAVLDSHRQTLSKMSASADGKAHVAIVPDFSHMSWHWAREEFYLATLYPEQGYPRIKGAGVPGRGIFVCWSRNFGAAAKDKTLYILRLVVQEALVGGSTSTSSSDNKNSSNHPTLVNGVAAVLRRAQQEAAVWQMDHVEIWNPCPLVLEAVAKIREIDSESDESGHPVVERDTYGIPSLKWGGKELGLGSEVDWVWNERYAWC